MAWPTVITAQYVNGERVSDVEREPTTGEKALIVATSPLWGLIGLAFKAGDAIKEHQKRAREAEAQRLVEEKAEAERKARIAEEYRLAEELRAKEDNEIFRRTNQLLALEIGGCIATIAKQYENYTSRWEYRCTMDNLIIRTRGGDNATVCFHNSDEMMDDLQRYRWAGFELV